MRYAPTLGDILLEQLRKREACFAGDGVAPGAKRHQQVAFRIKRQVAVHHTRQPQHIHRYGLAYRSQQPCHRRAQPFPRVVKRIGPDAVYQLIFPSVFPLRDATVGFVGQHSLDARGTKLYAQGGMQCFAHDEIPHSIVPSFPLVLICYQIHGQMSIGFRDLKRNERPRKEINPERRMTAIEEMTRSSGGF